ncbi:MULTISPECIES: hypothetical protein [Bacillus]|uniref:hypothetical protein n=1 Tax=Bacillus TaxID=1386 RepID=UPI000717B320|nr:hypothetical protein [Bacillus pumilus]KRU15424.1 hypothetical protein AS142_14650 [Bacillus pumilus]
MIIYLHEKSKEKAAIYLAAFFIGSNNRNPKPTSPIKGKMKVETKRIASASKGFDIKNRPMIAQVITVNKAGFMITHFGLSSDIAKSSE